MAERVTARTDKDHREALDQMIERGEADSRSEALRQTSQANLARRGYMNGHGTQSVAAGLQTVGTVFGLVGLAWLAATMFWPVTLRTPSMAFLVAAVGCFAVKRAVTRFEPRTIERIFGRGEKA